MLYSGPQIPPVATKFAVGHLLFAFQHKFSTDMIYFLPSPEEFYLIHTTNPQNFNCPKRMQLPRQAPHPMGIRYYIMRAAEVIGNCEMHQKDMPCLPLRATSSRKPQKGSVPYLQNNDHPGGWSLLLEKCCLGIKAVSENFIRSVFISGR